MIEAALDAVGDGLSAFVDSVVQGHPDPVHAIIGGVVVLLVVYVVQKGGRG